MNGELIPAYTHFLQTQLLKGETPLLFLEGSLVGQSVRGCFVLTDRRACFCSTSAFLETFKALDLATVAAVGTSSQSLGHVLFLRGAADEIRFYTRESQALFDLVCRRVQSLTGRRMAPGPKTPASQLGAEIKEVRVRANATAARPAPAPPPAPNDDEPPTGMAALEALERLAKLHDAGAVSDAEFQAKKADLLARL